MPSQSSPIPNGASRRLARAAKAAAHFDIAKSTLWLWAKSMPGFPPPLRIGGGVTYFDLDAIENYLVAVGTKKAV